MSAKKLELDAEKGAPERAVYEGVFDRVELRAALGAPALFTDASGTFPLLEHSHVAFGTSGARGWATDRFVFCAAHAAAKQQGGELAEVSLSRDAAREAVRFLSKRTPKGAEDTVSVRVSQGRMALCREGSAVCVSLLAEKVDDSSGFEPRGFITRLAEQIRPESGPEKAAVPVRGVSARLLSLLDRAGALGTREDRAFTLACYGERDAIWALSGSGRIGALLMPLGREPLPDVLARVAAILAPAGEGGGR